MEKIDILMATYNGEKYLKEQIESILNQTYTNIRLLISDDCSTDGTREIIKEYEKKDKRIITYFQEKNLGYVKNFEFLLTKVENDIYMLSDQDDCWLPEKVEHTYNCFKKNKADLVFTDLTVVDEKQNVVSKSFNDMMNLTRKINKTIDTQELVYLYNCVTGCTIMAKKDMLEKVLPIPTNSKHIFHDHWIALVTSINGKIVYLPEKLINYRQHENNQIGAKHKNYTNNSIKEIRNHLINVKLGIFESYVQNPQIFTNELKNRNAKAYNYYRMIQKKDKINFKGWKTFHNLYKNETFKYYLENFFILNLPCIAKILIRIKNINK